MRISLLLLVCLLLATPPLRGQSPRLHMEVDTAVVTVGDPITLTVSVDHSSDSRVIWPDSLDLTPFEILGGRALPPAPMGESTRSSMVLTLAAFELGDLEIPGFDIEVANAQGETAALTTNRFGIQVLTVGLDEGGDIREIRGPLGIPVGAVQISVLLLVLILAAALAWFFYRRFRRSDPESWASTPAAPYRPPHELALEALARIEESTLLERGQVKEYHIQVSEVIRTYIEGRFQVPALEMTTRDIMHGLGKVSLPTATLDGFRGFPPPVRYGEVRQTSAGTPRLGSDTDHG